MSFQPSPQALWLGRGKEAGRETTAQQPLPGLGTGRLKGFLLPSQNKDLHLGCSHHVQQLAWTMALCKEHAAEPQATISIGLEGLSSAPK